MTNSTDAEILLDLRACSERPQDSAQWIELWQRLHARLVGPFPTGEPAAVQLEPYGLVRVQPMMHGALTLAHDALVSVHSVLEPPAALFRCRVCAQQGRTELGSLWCPLCGPASEARICAAHAVFLDGCLRRDGSLRVTCDRHRPRCLCGCDQPAAFYCSECGTPSCESQRSASATQRHRSLCRACYEKKYPACSFDAACRLLGVLRCEYIDRVTAKRCAKRICPEHAWRWQIYGDREPGLVHCQDHRDPSRWDNADAIYQLVAGTALRNSRLRNRNLREHWIDIPKLQSVGWIFRQIRSDVRYPLTAFDAWLAKLHQDVVRSQSRSRLHPQMLRLLERNETQRPKDLRADERDQEAGEKLCDELRAILRSNRWASASAAQIRLVDYRPANPKRGAVLVVRDLPHDAFGQLLSARNIYARRTGHEVRIIAEKRRLADGNDG